MNINKDDYIRFDETRSMVEHTIKNTGNLKNTNLKGPLIVALQNLSVKYRDIGIAEIDNSPMLVLTRLDRAVAILRYRDNELMISVDERMVNKKVYSTGWTDVFSPVSLNFRRRMISNAKKYIQKKYHSQCDTIPTSPYTSLVYNFTNVADLEDCLEYLIINYRNTYFDYVKKGSYDKCNHASILCSFLAMTK